ncbi:hypothetical protein ACIBG8_46085 [Nonomuraea sp. NPDC050556]|uniref:hypothetical protein n=1 Tax=Nonomuraea sp. NPDC050556 TaxID=3364369 RepID=UPI0037974351
MRSIVITVALSIGVLTACGGGQTSGAAVPAGQPTALAAQSSSPADAKPSAGGDEQSDADAKTTSMFGKVTLMAPGKLMIDEVKTVKDDKSATGPGIKLVPTGEAQAVLISEESKVLSSGSGLCPSKDGAITADDDGAGTGPCTIEQLESYLGDKKGPKAILAEVSYDDGGIVTTIVEHYSDGIL